MQAIHETIERLLPEAEQFLCEVMRYPSTPGLEHDAMQYVHDAFVRAGAGVEKCALTDALRADPDYSDPIPNIRYDGRFNVRAARRGRGGGRTLLFNTHLDVVPPSPDMAAPWNPRVENGVVWGRGACDAKGQAATVYLVFKALQSLNPALAGDVLAHLVVEEENGGNGTLAMARRGEKADGCIVLEPTDGKLFTSIRGAVWFRLTLAGRAGHSGQAGVTRSALLMARDAIGVLEQYHANLLAQSRGFPLFDVYPNPMPITFGHLEAGNWPATAPSKAVIEGVLGLLPNKTKEQVCEEMRQALATSGDEFFRQNFELQFMYRHDSSVLDPAHALPTGLSGAAAAAGHPVTISAMTASCDAWMYNNQLKIPTVVYGPGALKVAHSKDEQIDLREIAVAAKNILGFVLEFCG
jgi:acetylornithine deacetylase